VGFDSADMTVVDYVSLTYGIVQVYVRNMTALTNQLVSIAASGYDAGNGSSLSPVLSADARWVAYKSGADNLASNPPSGTFRLYVRDLGFQRTVALAGGSDFPSYGFSADSFRLAYAQLTGGVSRVVVHDLLTRTNLFAADDCSGPSLSANGRWLAYESPATGVVKQVYARDLQSGQNELMSVNLSGTGGGNGPSIMHAISADGRFVVFASKASNLVAGDSNRLQDVFVRNRAVGKTLLVSQSLRGTGSGNSASGDPVLSTDGRTVVFQSFANDLVSGDYNDRRDVFVLRLAADDSDGDGLPDDWELAYFDTLDRDGRGDFDGDGHTDREEYLAGTDPTNRGSVLTVLTLQGAGTGAVTVLWASVPGRLYRVQFKDSLQAAWDELAGDVAPATATGSKLDDTAGAAAHRFYRVRVVE
jgi:Tol biopolymer transport system component